MKNKEIIEKMTLRQKALFMSGRDVWSTWAFDDIDVPSIVLSDGPHGIRKQMGEGDHLGINESMKSTCFPTAATVANSWDIELAEQVGVALGEEAVQLGVNVVLGPGLNLKRNPLCGRNFEYFSEDPYLTGKMASSYVKGIQSQGVSACPKHFAVNSQELRRMSNDSILDERTLRELYLRGFEIIVDEANPKFIMTSYNRVNGVHANENEHLLQDVLVNEWGYEGAVVSDWGGSNDHVEGVKKGSHLEMPNTGVMGALELIAGIEKGELTEEVLNTRVDKLLSAVLDLSSNKNIVNKPLTQEMVDRHHSLAKKVAMESVVLLENRDNVLPLSKNTKVAIVGDFAKTPRYQGAGSSVVNVPILTTVLEEVKNFDLDVVSYSTGYERNGGLNNALVQEAVSNSKDADVVLVFAGLVEVAESEGVDRKHMKLSENQNQLIEELCKNHKKVVVILSGGSPVELTWADKVQGLVNGYLGGQAGASAILEVLVGNYNPSGKLNETYAIKYEDVPNARYYPGSELTSEYREGLFAGYRYFETAKKAVKYPFGYGLSYTTFDYSNLEFNKDTKEVYLTVKNTGNFDGTEIVQVYSNPINSEIFRPTKELIGFTKVFIKKGEEAKVVIKLDKRAFEYYNITTGKWEIEALEYNVLVGKSVSDICLETKVTFEGTTSVNPYDKSTFACYYENTFDVTNVSDNVFEKLIGRKIPNSKWDKNAPLTIYDTVSQLYYAKSPIARFAFKIIEGRKDACEKAGKPDLNILFIYNQTFTGIYKMTNGMINKKMMEQILVMINGKFFSGLSGTIKEFGKNRKETKKVLESLKK